jgi:hypothetical protein
MVIGHIYASLQEGIPSVDAEIIELSHIYIYIPYYPLNVNKAFNRIHHPNFSLNEWYQPKHGWFMIALTLYPNFVTVQ